jgi:hypothetical protein
MLHVNTYWSISIGELRNWLSTSKATSVTLLAVIIFSVMCSADLRALPKLDPSLIDNKYDIPISIPTTNSLNSPRPPTSVENESTNLLADNMISNSQIRARGSEGFVSTVSSTDAGTNDKFGIKKIYPTKPGGEEWVMNMQDPNNDPRTKQIPMSKNADGSWKVTEDQVRYGVYTSSGYHPDLVVKDYSILADRGYMQSPNDWKNVEMTGQVKFNSGGDDDWTWYARGGRNTGNGWPEGCEGTQYKGSLEYTSGRVRWAKEQWHVSYFFSPWKNSPASGDHKFVGFKVVMYNFLLDGKTAVKMESYVDPNNDNQWQKVYDFVDKGGWGNAGGECKGAPDQIITWGGPQATFRWDNANIDLKNLSVREIVPPSAPTQ